MKNIYIASSTYVLKLQGDSMTPEFNDGDRLLVQDAVGTQPLNARVGSSSTITPFLRQMLNSAWHAWNPKYVDIAINEYDDVRYIGHVAKADKAIFEEFRYDWGTLSAQAEQITGLNLFDADPLQGAKPLSTLTNVNKVSRERHFFRRSVMATYEYMCCLSGVTVLAMLAASHIKPYSKCRTAAERTDPQNGLCLNMFYDKAYDQGIITIDPYYKVRVSMKVREQYPQEACDRWLYHLEGKTIDLPDRFKPGKKYLEYHTDKIFQW